MVIQSAYEQEKHRLEETLQEIDLQLSRIGPRYHGDNFVEQVLDDKKEMTRQRLELLNADPYFGRLDFQEEGQAQPVELYIGKRGMEHQGTSEPYIIDWRAPVASLFYSFTGGDEQVSFEVPESGTYEGIHEIHGEVHRKRNLSIRDKTVNRVVDSYVRGGDNLGLSDEFLLYRLGEKKDNRLRDIVSTIQAEQDRIIRAPRHVALIIQGAAGSGKTTVALHRLAYLLYQYQGKIRAERMIIFAPNSMFLDYISGVLPELGVGDVLQTTFVEWALDLLDAYEQPSIENKHIKKKLSIDSTEGKQWFYLQGTRPDISELTPGRFKGSLLFKEWIDEKLTVFEQSFLKKQDFEPWPGCSLPYEMMRDWFEVEYKHFPLAVRRKRWIGRLTRWMEIQLSELDSSARKDKSKSGKARLRAFCKNLPEVEAVSFYKSLFDVNHHKGIPKNISDDTRNYLNKGTIRQEDLAPLIWIHFCFHGMTGKFFDHVVVDEAQDVSPFQIAMLRSFMVEPSFTILGDLAQGIHAYRGINRWQELSALFEASQISYHELKQSYRSTLEIIEFANTILPFTATELPLAQPVFRSGEPVVVVKVDEEGEQISRILSFIQENQERGMRSTAIVGRTEDDCLRIYNLLEGHAEIYLVSEGQREYRGGLSIVPVFLAKGLEFDAVLLIDVDNRRYTSSPQDAKLLYVGCTRALHRLTILYSNEASPLISGR